MHDIRIEFVMSLFILGAAVLAFIHHTALYFFSKDRFLLHYLIYLFFTGIFLYAKTGLYAYAFGIEAENYMLYAYKEAIQIVYLTSYFNFIIHAIWLSGTKVPYLFRFWKPIGGVLLLYAALFTMSKVYFPLDDYTIPFVAIRIFIFAITGIMLYQSFKLREIRFQQIILYGCSAYMVCGLTSFITNLDPTTDMLIYPLEWLMIGSFIDIIFFSFAIGYRNKKQHESLNLSLLEEANKLIEKQAELENERSRIAADMHDDLGSGLTKITYLSQMAVRNDTQENLVKIKNTAAELVKNMGELIWVMKEENNTLGDLASYIRAFAADYFETNNVTLRTAIKDFLDEMTISGNDRRNIFLLVKECCHNIVKHSGAGTVWLSIGYADGLNITIKDDGCGIPENKLQPTSGNGLKNMRVRIAKMRGRMEILSGEGCEIRFVIPLQKDSKNQPFVPL
ncbi:hypothetical protein HYN48_10710 [Flavobacterium magnum]|uniref:Histidine kinase domain-containing protein n=1 Tax=Flavobacterium magnum TaxID=2162713 RepID=A0A2S0RFT0_9FLAO|nr:ATP-binding protein [Flavobacterium magnum]AWA30524.1 hypothetical protein HYN48_10710 [Flavobacterium magnum]